MPLTCWCQSSLVKRELVVLCQTGSCWWPVLDMWTLRDQVRTVLQDTIVVGFDIANDLKVLGISLPPQKVQDIQKYFNAEGCSQPDVRDKCLPALDGQQPKHSLKNLVDSLLLPKERRSFQDGPHSALEDARPP